MIPLRDDNPTTTPPIVTIGIIVLCALVFLWQQTLSQEAATLAVYSYGVVPTVLFHNDSLPPELARIPPELSILTSMFMHGGWMHIIGNMLYLWIFGNNIEDTLGHFRFLFFYLVCGLSAALAQVLASPNSTVPMIGASGAVAGILGAYVLLFPGARVLTLLFIIIFIKFIRIPAIIVLGFWFFLQLLGVMGGAISNVAFFAHIGGFVVGLILIKIFQPRWAKRRRRY